MALNPYDLFDVRSLLSEEERAVQDTVARFTDERVIPIIGEAFDQKAASRRNWCRKSPNSACSVPRCRRSTAAPASTASATA